MKKCYAPATLRNREAIAEVLAEVVPEQGLCLEIASGSGEHAVFFAERFAPLRWQPSDVDPDALTSIAAWRAEAGLENLLSPKRLDTRDMAWFRRAAPPPEEEGGEANLDLIVAINMIHISPWDSCEGLFRGARSGLSLGGLLYLYGPYNVGGQFTSESNQRFDEWLRDTNAAFGVRDLEAVEALGRQNGFVLEKRVAMPANNFSLVFRRSDERENIEVVNE